MRRARFARAPRLESRNARPLSFKRSTWTALDGRTSPASKQSGGTVNREHARRIVCDERLDAESSGASEPIRIVYSPDNDG